MPAPSLVHSLIPHHLWCSRAVDASVALQKIVDLSLAHPEHLARHKPPQALGTRWSSQATFICPEVREVSSALDGLEHIESNIGHNGRVVVSGY